jgi:hypothetical protein
MIRNKIKIIKCGDRNSLEIWEELGKIIGICGGSLVKLVN